MGRNPGLEVMGDNWSSRGPGLKSCCRILDKHDIFCKNCIVCFKRPKINEKEARVGPFLKYVLNYYLAWSKFFTCSCGIISFSLDFLFLNRIFSCHPTYTDQIFSRPIFASFADKTWSQKYDKLIASFANFRDRYI